MRVHIRAAVALLFAACLATTVHAQCSRDQTISGSGAGYASAHPDVAVLTLVISSSAPLAADAVTQDAKKAADVRSALKQLGYGDAAFQVTLPTLLRAGGPYYGNNQPAITGIEDQRYVYVFFRGNDLNDSKQLTEKMAAAVDALIKAGAAPASNPYAPQQESGMIVYTLDNPAQYEQEATKKAVADARSNAQLIASELGAKITGLCSASTNVDNYSFGIAGGMINSFASFTQVEQNPLAELPFRFYSALPERIVVEARATVTYSFQ